MSGAPSTEVMTILAAAELLGGEVAADRLRVVDREHRVDLGEAGQVALHDVEAALARALAVLVVGQDLDVRVLGQHLLAAVDPVDHGGDLRAVLDDDVALAAELVDDVLAGDLAGLDVVGLHRGVGAGGGDVDRHHHDAGRLRPLDRRGDRLAGRRR